MGLANANKGDYKKSLDYHYQSIEIAIQQNDSVQLAFAYNNLGRMFLDEGDLERAYDNLVRSKDLFEVIKDKPGLAYVYRSMASLFKSQKDFTRSLEMAARSLEIRRQIGNPRDLASSYMELGLLYQAMKKTKVALSKFAMADSIASTIRDKVTKAEIGLGLAEILFQERKFEEAFQITTGVLKAISDSTNRKLFLRSELLRGKYYFGKGNDSKAIPILEKIISDPKNSGTPYFQQEACNVLLQIYKRKNDPVRINEYALKASRFDQMLRVQDLTNRVERLQFQVEIEKKERENALLKATQAKNESVISRQRSQNILLFITVISIGALSVILWTSSSKRKLINQKLALQNQQISHQREEISGQNERLSQRNSQLSELNNEKDSLMNIVAHDLKSPLNQIVGLAELIKTGGPVSKTQADYLKMVTSASRGGLDMITDLLDVNALEEKGSNPDPSPFNLRTLLEELVKSHQTSAGLKGTTINLECEIEELVNSDKSYINRILDNLISNAIKFSPASKSILVVASKAGTNLVFSVKDHGPGFTEEDKTQMYQKFTKLSARPTGGESSNGLGLAIVKTLVDRFGGSIELETKISHGSTFTLKVPLGNI